MNVGQSQVSVPMESAETPLGASDANVIMALLLIQKKETVQVCQKITIKLLLSINNFGNNNEVLIRTSLVFTR